jgi:hypothetical protein
MASFFNIVHKTDKSYAPFHASTYEYATRLFTAILDKNPELADHLEIDTCDNCRNRVKHKKLYEKNIA